MKFHSHVLPGCRLGLIMLASMASVALAEEPATAPFYQERQFLHLYPDSGVWAATRFAAASDVLLVGIPKFETNPEFPGNSYGVGRAAVLRRVDGLWRFDFQINGLPESNPDRPYWSGFGNGVALNESGRRLVVGALEEDYQGEVDLGGAWIYEFGSGDDPTNSLLAYFSFDDPLNPLQDDSGRGLQLASGESGPSYKSDAGFGGSGAFSFNGAQQLIASLNINASSLPKLTMGAWVRTTSLEPGLRKIIGHDNGGWDRVIGLDNRFGDFRYTSFIGNGRPVPGTPVPRSTDEWTFIAVAYDQPNSEMTLYVDLDASTTDDIPVALMHPTDFNPGYETTAIGSIRPDQTAEGWEGWIDQVFFFEGALDLAAITRIRNGEILPGTVPSSAGGLQPLLETPQIVQRIQSDVDSFRQFGRHTAASGEIVAVFSDERHGASGPGSRPDGSVNIYLEENGVWSQVQKIAAVDSTQDFTGIIMKNGILAVAMAGARVDGLSGLGKVELYQWNEDALRFESDQVVAPEERTPTNQAFGTDIAFNGDVDSPTTIMVVGAPQNAGGRAIVYERSEDPGAQWVFRQKLIAPASDYNPDRPWNEFGNSVAVSTDGRVIAIQGYLPDGYGEFETGHAVYLFERVGDVWHYVRRLIGSRLEDNNWFGDEMTFAGDQLLIGSPRFNRNDDNQADGAIYVYDLSYTAETVADNAGRYLYTNLADDSPRYPKDRAAFRYLDELYESSASGPVATPGEAAAAFGPADEDRIATALELVRRGLAQNPDSTVLQNLLLDIYYDWTRILAIQAAEEIADVDFVRLDAPSTPGAFIIDQEIAAYTRALEANRKAYRTYLDLFIDDLGIDSVTPVGFTAFQTLVPSRALAPPRYLDGETESSVTGSDAPVLPAYRDLILLLDLLADQANHAAQLAFLLASNGDTDGAVEQLGDTDRELFAHAALLRGMFPQLEADRGDVDALDTACINLEEAFVSLSDMAGRITGENNLLGFDPDFLPLLPKPQGQLQTIIHTFDLLRDRLTANNETLNPVLRASNSQAAAVEAWDQYRNNQDNLSAQLSAISGANSELRERLIQIRGDGTLPPEQDPSTEIFQQIQNIERARNQIRRNQVESSNVRRRIEIEVERRTAASGIRDAMGQIRVAYGEAQATLTEQISYYEGMQKAVGSVADASNPAEFFSSLVTGLYVGGVEVAKGQLEAEKDRLAGQEEADILAQENLLEDVNSRANIRTWMLDLRTLAVDSLDAAIALKQEQGRLAAIWREKERLERRIAMAEAELNDRYFADPIHRFRARHQVFVANTDFRNAMENVFLFIKAFEYKWNREFNTAGWDLDTFFRIRNASELETLVSDLIFAESIITTGIDDSFDWFSFRDDFFGFKDIPGAEYVDPLTGEFVDFVTAFQSQLVSYLVDGDNQPLPEGRDPLSPQNRNLKLLVPFNTVREIPGGAFFEKEGYLDKIIAMHLRMPGSHSLGRSTVRGTLVYGGTAFIRNREPGVPDPARPDKLLNELSAYSTRVWNAEDGAWSYEDEQVQRVTITLDEDERIPPSVLSIDTFNERSVAASNWFLEVEIRDNGVNLVRIDEITDIEIYFHHASATR